MDTPIGNSSQTASQPSSQQPHTSDEMTNKLESKRRLASNDVGRLFIEYFATKKAKLSVPQVRKKNCEKVWYRN